VKRPAFQFYPADWRKDMALQSCSVAARGLWIDMMCIAHECEPYGHLTVNGRPMTAAQIGRHTGLTERECAKLLGELDAAGVFSRTDEGVIYSRRMVADEDLRARRAEGGKAGSEHGIKGAEHGVKGGRPREGRGVKKPPLKPPPSSSSSSSSSASAEKDPPASRAPPAAAGPRASRKPPADLVLSDEMRAWAVENAPLVDVDAELAAMRDYTFATARSDWPATLRNWLRKAQKDAQRRHQSRVNGRDEPEWRREQRERNEAFLGPYAAKRRRHETIDMESPHGAESLLG